MNTFKIKEIHNSDLYGIIVENTNIGAELLKVSGASDTIYYTKIPYSKLYQKKEYGDFYRSISKEYINKVLDKEIADNVDANINFVLVSSWQLNTENINGWLGLYINNTKYYFHYSFIPNLDEKRDYLINIISATGINILHSAINGSVNVVESADDNIILDQAYINDDVNYHLLLNTLEKRETDYFLVFDKEEPIRFIDLMRRSNEFSILRGSFNPIHYGHNALIEQGKKQYPHATSALLVSTFRYDKEHLNINEMISKIKTINSHGYPLIICKNPYFYGAFDLFNIWGQDKQYYLMVGCDTINRILKTDTEQNIDTKYKVNYYKDNFKFILFNRVGYNRDKNTHIYDDMIIENNDYIDDGISSTKLRNII